MAAHDGGRATRSALTGYRSPPHPLVLHADARDPARSDPSLNAATCASGQFDPSTDGRPGVSGRVVWSHVEPSAPPTSMIRHVNAIVR